MAKKLRLVRVAAWMIGLLASLSITSPIVFAHAGPTSRPPSSLAAPAVPVPGGPGFVMLSSMAFKPYHPNYSYDYDGILLYNPGASVAYYVAPIVLPNGASVTRLVAYYQDPSTLYDLQASLYKAPVNDSLGIIMALVSSNGADPNFRYSETTSIYSPLVDQQSYAYYVEVTLPAGVNHVSLMSVRVDYEFTTNLPLVNK